MERGHGSGRYSALLFVLVAFLLVVPPLSEAGYGLAAMGLGFPALLAICAFATGGERALGRTVLAIAVLAIAIDVVVQLVRPAQLAVVAPLLFMVVMGIVIFVILRGILLADRVEASSLLGGAAAYLLLGMLFWLAFAVVETLRPGSFSHAGVAVAELPGSDPETARHPQLLYFSLVTITTLGYGDVVPVHPLARMLATLEAVAGQLYIAILVAGLVGMHLADRRRPR